MHCIRRIQAYTTRTLTGLSFHKTEASCLVLGPTLKRDITYDREMSTKLLPIRPGVGPNSSPCLPAPLSDIAANNIIEDIRGVCSVVTRIHRLPSRLPSFSGERVRR